MRRKGHATQSHELGGSTEAVRPFLPKCHSPAIAPAFQYLKSSAQGRIYIQMFSSFSSGWQTANDITHPLLYDDTSNSSSPSRKEKMGKYYRAICSIKSFYGAPAHCRGLDHVPGSGKSAGCPSEGEAHLGLSCLPLLRRGSHSKSERKGIRTPLRFPVWNSRKGAPSTWKCPAH